MAKFAVFNNYVKVPCKKCYKLVKVRIYEKPAVCPYCHNKWN